MFKNIGNKIKTLAAVITYLGIFASLIGGIIIVSIEEELVLIGILVLVFGGLVSWISSFMLYAYGVIAQSAQDNASLSKEILLTLKKMNGEEVTQELIKEEKPVEEVPFFFCMQCGSKLQEGSKFCSKCGTPIQD